MALGDEVERLLTQANVERAKGNFVAARRILEQALQKAPERADIHEMLGDVYRAVGDLSTALECYRKAKELAPNRSSAEEKFAATLLALEAPSVPEETPYLPKNPALAAAFSALLPGAGQVYNEQWLKGIAIMTVTFVSLGYFLQFYSHLRFATKLPTLWQVQQQLEQASVGEILLLLVAGLTAFAMWTWSLLDAYFTARRFQQQAQATPSGRGSEDASEGDASEK